MTTTVRLANRNQDLRSTSKANISTTMVKQNNSLAIDTDTVNISTTNTTLNNQMDVGSIVTRMKSIKRRRNKTFDQTRKKSCKTQTEILDICLPLSRLHMNIDSHPKESKFTL